MSALRAQVCSMGSIGNANDMMIGSLMGVSHTVILKYASICIYECRYVLADGVVNHVNTLFADICKLPQRLRGSPN